MEKIKLSEMRVEDVKVLEYIPIVHKKMIIEGFDGDDGVKSPGIIDMCLKQDDDGMYYIDHFAKEVSMVSFIIQAYCINIEFDDIETEDTMYDFYISSGLWHNVKIRIPEEEYYKFMKLLERTLSSRIKNKNSIEGILYRGLNKLVETVEKNLNPKEINKLIKSFSKEFKNFDVNKLGVIKDIYGNIAQKPQEKKKKNE